MEKKTNDTRAIAPKIQGESAEFYSKMFPSLNAGATWILEEFPHLYRATLAEMRGKFTRGELAMILDALNGHGAILAYGGRGLGGQHIRLSIYDSFELYPGMYEGKWSVDKWLNDKLALLSRWQLTCLEIWAAGFWKGGYQNIPLDDYIKGLLPHNPVARPEGAENG